MTTIENSRDSDDTSKPLVFISHGAVDHELAAMFEKLLINATVGGIRTFRASDHTNDTGIPFGSEWYSYIVGKMEQTTHCVALLTEESTNRPWILFEAGYAKAQLDTPVVGLVVGIDMARANAGPFQQFQNVQLTEEQVTKLVLQIAKSNAAINPTVDQIAPHVQKFIADIREQIKNTNQEPADSGAELDGPMTAGMAGQFFEEIKSIVAGIHSTVLGQSQPAMYRGEWSAFSSHDVGTKFMVSYSRLATKQMNAIIPVEEKSKFMNDVMDYLSKNHRARLAGSMFSLSIYIIDVLFKIEGTWFDSRRLLVTDIQKEIEDEDFDGLSLD